MHKPISSARHGDCYEIGDRSAPHSVCDKQHSQKFRLARKHGGVLMKHSTNKQSFFCIMTMALLLAIAIPATALAQGRGRGHDRGNRGNIGWNRHDGKCGKFVNCHDARDGRLDGRGPRGDRVGYVLLRNRRNRIQNRPIGRRFWLQRRASVRNRRLNN
jgi:hypothetical protein